MQTTLATKSEPKWFIKLQRNFAKWLIKTSFGFLKLVIILILIVIVFMFLLTYLSWERIIRFFLESGEAVTEKFLAIFNTTRGA